MKKMEQYVGFYERYNAPTLACAYYYSINKTPDAMNICVKYLKEFYGLDDKYNTGVKMDILRYLRIVEK